MKIKCTCKHEYQDKKYGKGIRIGNLVTGKSDKAGKKVYRCTVCKRET